MSHPITIAPLPPIETLPLYPGERAALLELLGDLSPADWEAPTVCPGWSVKDVALHLLGDDIGRLSWGRDGYVNPAFASGSTSERFRGWSPPSIGRTPSG